MAGLRATAGVSVLALCAIAAPAASARIPGPSVSLGSAGGIEYFKAKFESVESQAGTPAVCDAGDYVLGGGGSINGDPSNAELSVIAPIASPDDGWLAEGASSGGPRTVTTYASCGNGVTDTTTSTTNYPAGTDFASGEECDPGERSLSGGVSSNNGDTTIATIFPDYAVFDWTNRFAVESDDTISKHVVCTSEYPRRVKAKTESVRRDDAGRVVRKCKAGHEALGGGFETGNDTGQFQFEVHAITSKPWDTRKDAKKVPDDGWLVKLYNDTGARLDLTAFAVCAT